MLFVILYTPYRVFAYNTRCRSCYSFDLLLSANYFRYIVFFCYHIWVDNTY